MIKIKEWIKAHKIAFGGIIVGIVIIGLIIYALLGSFLGTKRVVHRYQASERLLKTPPTLFEEKASFFAEPEETAGRGEIEIKEGSMEIKSKNVEADFAEIKTLVENYQGYIERSSKSSTNLYLWINLTLRVPSENLFNLFEALKRRFKVESY